MDTSEEYIKMCDCSEIQGHRKKAKQFEHGDLVANYEQYKKKKFVGVVMWEPKDQIVKRELAVWLPRQDQIQEMMKLRHDYTLFYRGQGRYTGQMTDDMNELIYGITMDSMEQLWLAFYMFENHQKIWDSEKEKWVKSAKE